MGVLDRFLNAMRLNDEDDYDDEDFLDDEIDDEYEEERPVKRRKLKKQKEDDFDDFDDFDADVQRKMKSKTRQPKQSGISAPTNSKISPMRPKRNSGMEVCVIKPNEFKDAGAITETLLANSTIVLNMEGMDGDTAQRIIDFVSGSCYAVDGSLQKISNYIFVITPSSVDISGDFNQILNGAFDAPAIRSSY